ncbi:hypothetical protein D7Z26_15720 [Cohnella endophytica]|uniref:Uncharacterized protein n=1 Tax=Cohnella endophytica TaxID=2419778 RepID=A0A494XYI6_9BACL|nr:hypothetical protein [Cohnella endophytica]RKP53174.1 hypothetical protein D7Z26_15720 [Cohnella endophytica]
MERILVDFGVNIFETIAGISLILAIYRFPVMTYIPQILFAAVVMAQTSYLLREVLNQESITPLFMIAWIFVFLWLMFRVHYFYAFLMAITGFLGYILIEVSIVYLTRFLNYRIDVLTDFYAVKIIQLISSTITLLICITLLKKRIGFSFVPDRMREKVDFHGTNRLLLYVLIIGSLLASAIVFIYERGTTSLLLAFASAAFALYAIFYFALMKERSL